MSRSAAIMLTVAALGVGFAIGLLAARSTPESPERMPRAEAQPTPPPPPSDDREAEILSLRERIRKLESIKPSARTDENPADSAEEIHRALTDLGGNVDTKTHLRALGELSRLAPEMTAAFVRKFRASQPKFDAVAFELAIASGGPEAIELIKEIFQNEATSMSTRVTAAIALSGRSLTKDVAIPMAVDPTLLDLADRLLAQPDRFDRQAGIGIFGLQDDPRSRAALQARLALEQDELARMSLYQALGKIGDRGSMEFMVRHAESAHPELFDKEDDDLSLPEQALKAAFEEIQIRVAGE